MPNQLTERVLIDGSRHLALILRIFSDGSGNDTNRPILNINGYNNPDPWKPAISIKRIDGHTGAGTTGFLSFYEDGDEPFYQLPTNEDTQRELYPTSGIVSPGDWDGKIYLTSTGADASGDYIEIRMIVKKIVRLSESQNTAPGQLDHTPAFPPVVGGTHISSPSGS
jgi:hypothetical protein